MNASSSKSFNCIFGSASVEHMQETIRRKGQLKGRQADEVSFARIDWRSSASPRLVD